MSDSAVHDGGLAGDWPVAADLEVGGGGCEPVGDHHRFVEAIRQACGVGPRQARRLVRAVLETLAETLLPKEARRLASRLPAELAPYVGAGPAVQRMETLSREEFVRRVMVRTGAEEQKRGGVVSAIEAVVAVTMRMTGVFLPPGPFSRRRLLPEGDGGGGQGGGGWHAAGRSQPT